MPFLQKDEVAMKIAIGSDHAGFKYKEAIRAHLAAAGCEVKDFGTFSDQSCDYPTFIRPVAEAVHSHLARRRASRHAAPRSSHPKEGQGHRARSRRPSSLRLSPKIAAEQGEGRP